MEVAPGVRRLGSRYTNFYLIEDRRKLTLLDAGLPGYWTKLLDELAIMGCRLEDIDAVLLTHCHPDHTGIAERVRRLAAARVLAPIADAPIISGQQSAPPPNFLGQLGRPFIARYLLHSLRAGAARRVPVANLGTFDDGEILDVPGRPRVVHVPGHTAGQCALMLESRRVLFSADALVTIDLRTGEPAPSLPPDFVNVDSGQATASLSALERFEADVVLPGHGEPWLAGVSEAVRLARLRGSTRSASSRGATPVSAGR